MDLCRDCHGFAWAVSQGLHIWPGLDSFWNVDRLRAESHNCRLCKMICDHIFADAKEEVPYQCSKLFYMPFHKKKFGIPVTSVVLRSQKPIDIKIAVWSDDGSPAAISGKFCTEPPLPSDNCPEAFAFIRSWIQACSQKHELCKRSPSKSYLDEAVGPKLPTRILDVGPRNHESVSLFETNDQRGEFCALSYCWGPEGTQTLITTRDNINDHLSGIKFSSLPKTFQDAVIITRELGIRYLWIDSLCIIQGDKSDWMKESTKMAGVYQNAYLVIAASGAANPKEGCFSTERRCSTTVEIPYYPVEGQAAGSIKLSMRIYGEESPSRGPLAQRGWALQEWYLARRVLHYMPSGISWKCKMFESGERGRYDMAQYSKSWESILEQYSDRKLTHKEDRLAALEGLAQARLEGTNDGYKFGIFESRILEQLLWMMEKRARTSEDLLDMPHWSWASKGGSKVFWTDPSSDWQPIQRTRAIIEPFDILRVDGYMAQSRTSIAKSRISTQTSEQMLPNLLTLMGSTREGSLYWIQTKFRQTTRTIGTAAFDRAHYAKVYILYLQRWRGYEQ
ncbi:heterokaryon incompatibility domain-containing protein [Trichoderma velutinum]